MTRLHFCRNARLSRRIRRRGLSGWVAALLLPAAGALAMPLGALAGTRVGIGVGVNVGGPGYRGYVGYGRPYWGGYRHGAWGGYYGYRPAYWGGYYGWGPYWGPGPYWGGVYAPLYPPATIVTVPVSPPVYVERQEPAPQTGAGTTLEPGFWYYCRNPQGYYPTVGECPGGWVKVPPRPASAQ